MCIRDSITSKDIREGWIETVQFIADTIQEKDVKTEAIAIESIKDIAIIAIKTAIKAADDAKTDGVGPITAIFMAEEAGINAAITSIKAAQAKVTKDETAAGAAVGREIAMIEAANASLRTADAQSNEDKATI